jgi:hypothetical protein
MMNRAHMQVDNVSAVCMCAAPNAHMRMGGRGGHDDPVHRRKASMLKASATPQGEARASDDAHTT